jgi:hypothetical protein
MPLGEARPNKAYVSPTVGGVAEETIKDLDNIELKESSADAVTTPSPSTTEEDQGRCVAW